VNTATHLFKEGPPGTRSPFDHQLDRFTVQPNFDQMKDSI